MREQLSRGHSHVRLCPPLPSFRTSYQQLLPISPPRETMTSQAEIRHRKLPPKAEERWLIILSSATWKSSACVWGRDRSPLPVNLLITARIWAADQYPYITSLIHLKKYIVTPNNLTIDVKGQWYSLSIENSLSLSKSMIPPKSSSNVP